MNLFENLQLIKESEDIDNKLFTPGSDDEKDYEQSQSKQHSMSEDEELYYIKLSIENGPYTIKFNNNQYILDSNREHKTFNLIGIRGFINRNKQRDNSHILNNMIIVTNNNKEYNINSFNDMLEKYGIWKLNV